MNEKQVAKGYELIKNIQQINTLITYLPEQYQQPMDLQDYDVSKDRNLMFLPHPLISINTVIPFEMYKLAIKNELLELKRKLEKELEEL